MKIKANVDNIRYDGKKSKGPPIHFKSVKLNIRNDRGRQWGVKKIKQQSDFYELVNNCCVRTWLPHSVYCRFIKITYTISVSLSHTTPLSLYRSVFLQAENDTSRLTFEFFLETPGLWHFPISRRQVLRSDILSYMFDRIKTNTHTMRAITKYDKFRCRYVLY